MGEQSTSWSWRHAIISSDLAPTTRHVLLTISCYMNDVGGGCYPTTKQLQKSTGLSERAVCEHIGIAERAGWLTISKHGLAGQKWKNHQYSARWPNAEGTDVGSVPSAEKALTQDQRLTPKGTDAGSVRNCEGTDPNDKKALTDGQSNSPYTTPIERGRARYDQFDRALKACPTGAHDSRKDALEAWSALSTEDRAEARSEIGRFLATGKSGGRTVFCTFATYLRERKWQGLPERPKTMAAVATVKPVAAAPLPPNHFSRRYEQQLREQARAANEAAKP
ncbi:helix-turn-helix domain-containing protein [Mesorhizobium sp. M7A.F.Ca.US.001.01.1.1]|nr:helix-turn-helix domain-containing protein [Mesorhizobium sp. M7A.F.Ca.US.001.01.1.1]